MNFIFISPYFPSNFANFCTALKEKGVTVLGIGDESYDSLSPQLKDALTEYYRVDAMADYDAMYRACGYFAHKYGHIDRIESNNEHWLETDARLRTDFNVPGLKTADMEQVKYKSGMKDVFRKAGIKVAQGRVVRTAEEARLFVRDTGFPVVVKPDNGVGASSTYKFEFPDQLESFFENKPDDVVCIMEEYIQGVIHTFDGLTDQEGNIVFSSSLSYSAGIMETVNGNLDMHYHIPRELPPAIVEAGEKSVKAFGLKERFFHLEFFLTEKGVYALEINVRPPGGLTVDMFNFANDIDIFREYANVVTENRFTATVTRPYHCFYLGRKNGFRYRNSIESALERFGDHIVYHSPIASIFSAAIGDYGVVVRTPEADTGREVVQYVMEKETEA